MLKPLLAFLVSALPVFAALPATTIMNVSSTATSGNVNGGGFNWGHASFPTDLACTSATGNAAVCTSASYNFVAGDVGGWLFVQSGTNWYANQFCPIASVAANAATLTSTAGSCVILSSNRWLATTVAGVASTASPTGGVWGVAFNQQDAAESTGTDGVSVTTSTTFTTAIASSFRTVMKGNFLHITTTGTGAQCITGWYHIESVTDTLNVVLDRAPSAGTGCAAATWYVAGSSIFGALDDALFEIVTSSATAGFRYFIKNGSYAPAGTINTSVGGNVLWPAVVEGYNSIWGDRPTGSTRPTLAFGGSSLVYGNQFVWRSVIITGTPAALVTMASNGKLIESKVVNTSTTTGRTAITTSTDFFLSAVEAVSYRGIAVSIPNVSGTLSGSYIHDSDTCVSAANTSLVPVITGNLLVGCPSYGARFTAAATAISLVYANTIYGYSTPIASSIGVGYATGVTDTQVVNNIIIGWSTGISHADNQSVAFSDYNDLFNNTTPSTNWQTGAHSVAVDPQFSSVGELSGATATTSGSVLTQSGGNFSTVTDGSDFLYLISGTGVTAGIYGITSHTSTTVTVDIAPGTNATADKVWRIITGRNFAVGTNLKALGFPGAFPAALTTAYTDIGGAQRQEAGSGGSQHGYTRIQ